MSEALLYCSHDSQTILSMRHHYHHHGHHACTPAVSRPKFHKKVPHSPFQTRGHSADPFRNQRTFSPTAKAIWSPKSDGGGGECMWGG